MIADEASITTYEGSPVCVDMSEYLPKHDIVYQTPGYEGYEGFPLGNGNLGGMLWCTERGVRLQINKTDTWDGTQSRILRSCASIELDFGAPCFEWKLLKDFEGRLSLHEAEATFCSTTPFVRTALRSYVTANENIWLIECEVCGTGELIDGAATTVSLERWGSRDFRGWYNRNYDKNPEQGLGTATTGISGGAVHLQESFTDLKLAVACSVIDAATAPEVVSKHCANLRLSRKPVQKFVLAIAVATSNDTDDPVGHALSLLDNLKKSGVEATRRSHLEWWRTYWERSFVSIPNDYFENLYYVKRYIIASSSRGRYPALFNGSIWLWNRDVRNWRTPHHWNMQQSYWGLCSQGDADLLRTYLDAYWRIVPEAEAHAKMRGADDAVLWSEGHDYHGEMSFWNRSDMLNNFSPATQIAGFFWEYYRYTGDAEFLEERAYPFMKKAASFYLHYLKWDETKDEYYMFPSQSYECPGSNSLKNPATDRFLLESLFRRCIEASILLDCDEDIRTRWQYTIDHLWTQDMIDVPEIGEVFTEASDENDKPWIRHEGSLNYHFSPQSCMVFPADLIGIPDRGNREYKAVENFINGHPANKNAITPDSIVAARMGISEKALWMLGNSVRRMQQFPQGLFYNIDHWHQHSYHYGKVTDDELFCARDYIHDDRCTYAPNGLPTRPFVQCGMEALGSLGATINEMLLQSYDGCIRVFPAVPDDWEATFSLFAVGGFQVSAERVKTGVRFVHIVSSLGNRCVAINPWPGTRVAIERTDTTAERLEIASDENERITFDTDSGGAYLLRPVGKTEPLSMTTLRGERNQSPKEFYEAILGKKRNF